MSGEWIACILQRCGIGSLCSVWSLCRTVLNIECREIAVAPLEVRHDEASYACDYAICIHMHVAASNVVNKCVIFCYHSAALKQFRLNCWCWWRDFWAFSFPKIASIRNKMVSFYIACGFRIADLIWTRITANQPLIHYIKVCTPLPDSIRHSPQSQLQIHIATRISVELHNAHRAKQVHKKAIA